TKGSNLVNEFRASYNRFNQPLIPLNRATPQLEPLMGLEKAFPFFIIGSFDLVGSGQEFRREVNVYNYVDNASYTVGNHQLKVGVDARRYLSNFFVIGPNTFVFDGTRFSPAQPDPPIRDFLLGLTAGTQSLTGSPGGNARKFEFSAYVQDDWKVNS